MRIAIVLFLFIFSGCSAIMAASGEKDPSIQKIRVGISRAEIEKQLGVPIYTISESNKEGWIRPAIPGVELAPKVAKFAAKLAPLAFEAYVEGLTGG